MSRKSRLRLPHTRVSGFASMSVVVLLAVVILVVVASIIIVSHRHTSTTVASSDTTATQCLSKQFALGSSGSCVRDIQTMVNFMETDGLTQCPFIGSAPLSVSGSYDAATAAQVSVVQTWLSCFDKQEGIAEPHSSAAVVAAATWSELCTYAYTYPSQNSSSTSPYRAQALAAGKDAGCAAPSS